MHLHQRAAHFVRHSILQTTALHCNLICVLLSSAASQTPEKQAELLAPRYLCFYTTLVDVASES